MKYPLKVTSSNKLYNSNAKINVTEYYEKHNRINKPVATGYVTTKEFGRANIKYHHHYSNKEYAMGPKIEIHK